VDTPQYGIPSACNPTLAHHGLQAEDKLGVLLPRNSIVREVERGRTEVRAIDPVSSMQRTKKAQFETVASEARARLQRALDSM
jgi:uncharacterized protein (DUF302 family)